MQKKIIIFIVLLLAAIIGYMYIYQGHRNIGDENAKFEISSNEIALEFVENPKRASVKYLNITIEVSGKVSEKDSSTITLDDKVFCQFNSSIKTVVTNNSALKIKGRVIGYDDLLEQVKLDQCSINK